MGLFGSAKKSSFETKPDPRVASMLKDILHEANDMDSFEFIQHQAAQLNPEQQQAIQNLAQSGNLRAVAGALSPRLAQGIDQATALNKVYSDAADSAVNPNDVIKNAESLRTGLAATARTQGAQAGGIARKFGAVGASTARRGAQYNEAMSKVDNRFTNQALSAAQQNQQNKLDVARMQQGIAGTNQQLGLQGIQNEQQATANQLQAGNFMQAYQQGLNLNDQQNAQGQQDFLWQKIANKQAILGAVSPMAGYKSTTVDPTISKGNQLLGAGLTAFGAAGRAGMFNNLNTTANAWDSYNQNGGQSGVAGPMPNGGNLSQQPAAQGSGLWSGIARGASGALSSMFG